MTTLAAEMPLEPVDPRFGERYGDLHYVTPDGFVVWMWRRGQRCRFYDARGVQHGPEQEIRADRDAGAWIGIPR